MRSQIDVLIARREFEALSTLLHTADLSSVRYAADRFADSAREAGDDLFAQINRLMSDGGETSQALACQLVPHAYEVHRKQAMELLERLAESEVWTVRDAACEVMGRLAREDFAFALGVLETWRTSSSANVRRAVVVAAARAADPQHLERAEPLLRLLEPLLPDRDPLVRRLLGASAIGSVLLAHYPNPTFEYLVKWSTSNDAQTLWNVAMALSAPPAVPLAKKALIVLRKLSLDERRLVWRAVASALWKLGRKRPDVIRPELARWLEDEDRINVAREAIKYL